MILSANTTNINDNCNSKNDKGTYNSSNLERDKFHIFAANFYLMGYIWQISTVPQRKKTQYLFQSNNRKTF